MAVTNLVNLVADPFTNPATAAPPGAQTLQTPAQAQPPPTPTAGNAANATAAEPQDQFVASDQDPLTQASADAAGLFTVTQAAAFIPAADTLLAQVNPPPINAANTPADTGVDNATTAVGATALPQAAAANATGADATLTNAVAAAGANATGAAAVGADATVTNAAGTTASAASATGANPATATAGTVAGTANVETQLQTLNNALQALGLSTVEINQIDQIASLSSNFDPNAFTSLAYQLLTQSPEAAKQTAANVTPAAGAAGGAQVGAQAKLEAG